MSKPVVVVSASVVTSDPQHIARAAEVLARAAAGLVLDGIDVTVGMGTPTEDDEEADVV